MDNCSDPTSTRRRFLRVSTAVLVVSGIGANRTVYSRPNTVPRRMTPARFRSAEQGMLALLGNPTEAAAVDLAHHSKAWDKSVADFAAQGVHLFFPHIPLTDCWGADGHYDFAPLDAVIRRTLKSDPQASLILRLRLKTPTWWIEQHPDQVLIYADGTDSLKGEWGAEVKTSSLASMVWRRDVENLLRALIKRVEQSDYAERIVGCHPALMNGGEWFQEGASHGKKADYSPVMEKAFRTWLEARYPHEGFPDRVIPITVPMAILFNLSPSTGDAVGFLFAGWTFFIHANLRLQLGPLSWLFDAPQVHRIHHSRLSEHFDRNFAAFFPIWDVVFGTYFHPRRGEFPPTSIPNEPRVSNVIEGALLPFRSWWQQSSPQRISA
jgi:hypothetical protein